jgi:hypothetical protein
MYLRVDTIYSMLGWKARVNAMLGRKNCSSVLDTATNLGTYCA